MGTKVIVGKQGAVVEDLTPEEEAQRLLDIQAAEAQLALKQEELARVQSIEDDVARQTFAERLANASNSQIDAFVESRLGTDAQIDAMSAAEIKEVIKTMRDAFKVLLKLHVSRA